MIKINKINTLLISIFVLISFCVTASVLSPAHTYAAGGCKPSKNPLAIPNCANDYSCNPGDGEKCLENNPIIVWLNFFINVFAAVIGVGAVAMLIFAGVQYTTAADNPSQVEAAKKKIGAVVLGLVAFIFLYAFLNWLIPGGVIG